MVFSKKPVENHQFSQKPYDCLSEHLTNQQRIINKRSHGFDLFFPVKSSDDVLLIYV